MNDISDKQYLFECKKCKMLIEEDELKEDEGLQLHCFNFDIQLKCKKCNSVEFKIYLS